ncbi:lipid A-modifier LpxR family protein [Leeuwenhoekiella sp. MAR_2009_132]|uniref:lipid A-modifier LpxR family protein n=1 Tax=Leeuwenhoekiella sp. MAR_2009_132 TaxID=1392489 RepID=UPI00397786AA
MKVFNRLCISFLMFFCAVLHAQNNGYKYELTIGHDNDFTVFGTRTDWHYTYGIHLDIAWLPEKETVLSRLFTSKEGYMQRAGLHIQAYTPDYSITRQLVNIRQPYAGWGYADFEATYAFKQSFFKLKLDLGILGPAVQAGEIQNFIHQYVSYDILVNQWDDQIPNKLGVNLNTSYASEVFNTKWVGIYGKVDASVGTIFTFVEPALHLRLGKFETVSKTNSQRNTLFAKGSQEFFFEGSLAAKYSIYNATIEDADANGTVLVPDSLVNHFYINASLGAFISLKRYSLGLKWNYTDGEIKGNKPHRYLVLKGSFRFN